VPFNDLGAWIAQVEYVLDEISDEKYAAISSVARRTIVEHFNIDTIFPEQQRITWNLTNGWRPTPLSTN
jgi:hypothetical protein